MHQVLELRRIVFIEEQNIPENLELDQKDEISVHVAAFVEGQCVATGRLTPVTDKYAVLSRIAIHKEYRSKGLGKEVVKFLEKESVLRGFKDVSLNPHAYLEDFYNRLGYKKIKDLENVGSHPLILMEKHL